MNKIQLYFLLRKHVKLSNKRHPMFEANQYGLLFGYIVMAFLAIEFIALGTFFGWLAATEGTPELIFYFMLFFLVFDFGMRFAGQQTPLMLVKPYMLTPVSKFAAIDCFLVNQLFSGFNFFWLTIFLPYLFIIWCGGIPFWTTLGMLILLQLMVVVNSQWYLFVRTLINQSLLWWALPVLVYGSLLGPLFLLPEKLTDQLFDFVGGVLDGYIFSWWMFLFYAVLLAVFFVLNRRMQMHYIYDEVSKNENSKMKHVSEFNALNRFGQIGEYLKLEIKSTMRNKAIRGRFIQGICIITFFSLAIAFGEIYKGSFSRNFLCLYAFIFFGAVNLIKIMCPEGNYIDLLMVHEENILTLLRAKYYFYSAILLLPLLLQLFPVIMGQFSILMILAYLFTATGPVYFMLFHLAIFNKDTLPLNDKITGKNQMENKWQSILLMVAMFVPVVAFMLLDLSFGTTTAYWILIVVGLLFTVTEPYWMRTIYNKMMRRRYQNLEGFHTTR